MDEQTIRNAAMEYKRKQKRSIITAVICIAIFAVGFLTSTLYQKLTEPVPQKDFAKLYEIYNRMNDQFYFGKDKENFSQKLIDGAIDGMIDAGDDPHTVYFDTEKANDFTGSLEGSYVGIGVQYYELNKGIFIVDHVYKASPAEEAGLMEGDQFYTIDGKPAEDMSKDDVSNNVKGEPGTTVHIVIIREGRQIEMDVERRSVDSSVFSVIEGDTAILKLESFAESSSKEMGRYLQDAKDKGCTKLIFDFRNNGGGYLDAAQEIASYLIPDDTVIFAEKARDGSIMEYKTLPDYPKYTFDKIVVIVNENSASATEVLTSALKDRLDVTVVGQTTYGKGTVQTPVFFKDGSMFKYTIAEWLTSKQASINGAGIIPDIEIPLDPALTLPAPRLGEDETYGPDTVSAAATVVQYYLKFLGYSVDRTDAYFSARSSDALKQYQSDKGLDATGEINRDTVAALLSSCSLKWDTQQSVLDTQMAMAKQIVKDN